MGSTSLLIQRKKQEADRQRGIILTHLEKFGKATSEDFRKIYHITPRCVKNRLNQMRREGLISCYQGQINGSYKKNLYIWVLGELPPDQQSNIQMKKPEPFETNAIAEMPEHIRKLFGFTDIQPAKGRHVDERMPDISPRKMKYTIGCGTYAHIESMGN